MPLPPLSSSQSVDIIQSETVWSGRFQLDVVTFRQRRFDGSMSGERVWELFRRGRAAAVLPYDPWTDQVVLMEQFRLAALAADMEPVMVEVAAGLCDTGEEAETTARREVREEMGLETDLLEKVGDYLLTPGGSDERCALFAGRVRAPLTEAGAGFGLASENEDIRRRVWPADRAIEAAVAGQFPNSVTAIALLWLGARRTALRAQWRQS